MTTEIWLQIMISGIGVAAMLGGLAWAVKKLDSDMKNLRQDLVRLQADFLRLSIDVAVLTGMRQRKQPPTADWPPGSWGEK